MALQVPRHVEPLRIQVHTVGQLLEILAQLPELQLLLSCMNLMRMIIEIPSLSGDRLLHCDHLLASGRLVVLGRALLE